MVFTVPYILLAFATLLSLVSASSVAAHRHRDSLTVRATSRIGAFLEAHNQVRSAAGAEDLAWSFSLASKAQSWADSCVFAHTDGALGDIPYGENMVAATGNFDIPAAVATFTEDECKCLLIRLMLPVQAPLQFNMILPILLTLTGLKLCGSQPPKLDAAYPSALISGIPAHLMSPPTMFASTTLPEMLSVKLCSWFI